jgi:hypothetical protein
MPPTRVRTNLDVALHEVSHAAYAQATGARVESIALSPEPCTRLCLSTDLRGLRLRWRTAPLEALRDVIHVAGTYLAPYVLCGEPLPDSDDLRQLQGWQRAWTALPPPHGQEPRLPWEQIVRLAWRDVAGWGGRADAAVALEWLAVQLVSRRFWSGRSWLVLWHARQARPLWSDERA